MALGKFITFEGGEGSGKSTQSKLLVEYLQEQGIDVTHTREPGGTEGAEAIRSLLVNGEPGRWDSVTEVLLLAAARRDHVMRKIRPSLEAGTWVICDRYVHSTIAYQGYGHGLGLDFITMISNITIGHVLPCVTFFLDIDPMDGLKRAHSRNTGEDRFENMDISFHETLQRGFRTMAEAEPERMVSIDASQSIESIQHQIRDTVNQKFNLGSN
ncbi:MAG: dTMP kinase [Rickettsiales bacterium]|nr:dTMP kinase [Rickettsiales bacterium]